MKFDRRTSAVVIMLSLIVAAASPRARADEGLERITELGDRDLVTKENAKKKPAKPKETFKAVEDEDDKPSTAFKGEPPKQSNTLSFGLGSDFFAGFGLQARYAARLIDKGPIADINNSLFLEGGVALTFYGNQSDGNSATGFGFLAAGRWDFQLNQDWVFFAKLGLGASAVTNSESGNVRGGGLFPVGGGGAIYTIAPAWGVRGDVGYEFTGVSILYRF